mmetsp:Transcript_15530/g.27275  ORF Transcript_15530/g.27275 Transcript_15530/m.27275 type:complete len:255 (-) Transcript_15530:835-1599(-)
MTNQQETGVHGCLVLVIGFRFDHLGDGAVAAVVVRRREMSKHLRAIQAFPNKRSMRELVEQIPGKLLGHKVLDANLLHDLGELSRVAKGVWEPKFLAQDTKLVSEELLAIIELTDERLTIGHIAVHLDPGTTNGNEATLGHILFDALIQTGIVLLHHLELSGLWAAKLVGREFLHQPNLSSPGTTTLAHGLFKRPQPCGVDMAMTNRVYLVGSIRVLFRQPLGRELAALFPSGSVIHKASVDDGVDGLGGRRLS